MVNYNLLKDERRMVFKIPVKPLKRKKWWQFWKKDDNQEAKEALLKIYRDYFIPTRPDKFDRCKKIENIKNKINANYHSLYE
jgi:hypothetical protein